MASPGVYDLNKLKSPLPETVPHKRQFVSFLAIQILENRF